MLSSGKPCLLIHKVFVEKTCRYRVRSRDFEHGVAEEQNREERLCSDPRASKISCRVSDVSCQESACPLLQSVEGWSSSRDCLKCWCFCLKFAWLAYAEVGSGMSAVLLIGRSSWNTQQNFTWMWFLPLACQLVWQYRKVNRVTDDFDFAG